MTVYRVLIADDHPLARKAVAAMLSTDKTFFIVGEAYHGEEAVMLCKELQPDLVLMDIHMSPMNGLEATRQIKQNHPHIRVVMLTVSDAAADLFTAVQYGAQGYLLKNMDPDEWLAYLHALLDDDTVVGRNMADRLLHQFKSNSNHSSIKNQSAPPVTLTSREREIVGLVASGDSNRLIAERLNISEHTVKNHMKNIFEKLHLDNRVQLTAYAMTHNLSQDGQN
jgi:two-component system, NarL family, nitrate/nitrite response regulator NarL